MKRTRVIFATALAFVLLAVSAVPVFAQDGMSNSTSTQDMWQNTAVVILNSTQEPNSISAGNATGNASSSMAAGMAILQMAGNNISDLVNLTKSGNAYVNVHTQQSPPERFEDSSM